MTRRPEKFALCVLHDVGVYRCIDKSKPLHLTEAKGFNALRALLLPLVRSDFAGDDTELPLLLVKDIGPRRPCSGWEMIAVCDVGAKPTAFAYSELAGYGQVPQRSH